MNLSILDEEIQRLQEIRRVMSDPKSAALVKQLFAQQPNGNTERSDGSSKVDTRDDDSDTELTTQIGVIRHAASVATGSFTTSLIGDVVRGAGLDIDNVAVGKVLQRLLKREEIRLVRKGKGNKPNRYEKANIKMPERASEPMKAKGAAV
jgi:hypothetical protein